VYDVPEGGLITDRKYENRTYQERLIETSWLEDWSTLITELNPQLPLDPLNKMNQKRSVILVDNAEQFDDSDAVDYNLNSTVNEPVVLNTEH
jgi:hypothetical protein